MKAFTVHRPWDFAIRKLGKDIENRSWAPPKSLAVGSTLAIHAGKKWDSAGADWIRKNLGIWLPPEEEHATGITGVVQYNGVLKSSASKWFMGPLGWELSKAQSIKPIPCRGKQKLWHVPTEIEEEITRALNPPARLASDELLGRCGEICGQIGGATGLALWLETESLYHKGDASDLWANYQMLLNGPAERPHPLYTYGYEGGQRQQLRQLMTQYGACLLDIRNQATSGTTWHPEALKRKLPRYHHVRSLGNKNEQRGGPIKLNNAEKGIPFVCDMLRWQPVILLCGCLKIEGCHRQLVSKMVKNITTCRVKHIGQKNRYETNQLRLAA